MGKTVSEKEALLWTGSGDDLMFFSKTVHGCFHFPLFLSQPKYDSVFLFFSHFAKWNTGLNLLLVCFYAVLISYTNALNLIAKHNGSFIFFCIRIPTIGSDLNVWLWVGGHASGVLQDIALLKECVICRGEWEGALRALSLTLLAVDLSALFLVGQDMSLQLHGIIAVPSACCQASLPLDP